MIDAKKIATMTFNLEAMERDGRDPERRREIIRDLTRVSLLWVRANPEDAGEWRSRSRMQVDLLFGRRAVDGLLERADLLEVRRLVLGSLHRSAMRAGYVMVQQLIVYDADRACAEACATDPLTLLPVLVNHT